MARLFNPNLNTKAMYLFGEFPLEIQLAIWTIHFSKIIEISQRIVPVGGKIREYATCSDDELSQANPGYTRANLENFFHVCEESVWTRYPVYKYVAFAGNGRGSSLIDPKSQILLLDSESLSGPLFTSFVSRNRNALFEISLKTLAIRIEVCQPETFVRTENTIPGRDGFWLLDVLRIFRSIEELIFVYDPDQAYQKELHDQYVMDMKTDYSFYSNFWTQQKIEPPYLLPKVSCMTYSELEAHANTKPKMILRTAV